MMSLFSKPLPPIVLIISIGSMVGVSFTLSKVAANAGAPPFTALFWQLLVATLVLLTLGIVTGRRLQLTRNHLAYYMGAGILGISAPALIAYTVLGHLSTGFYSALVTLSPLFTFVITAGVERQMLPLHRLIGILVGLIGVSLVTLTGLDLVGTGMIWIGLAVLGPLALAMGNVFRSRAYPVGGDPIMMATGALLSQLIIVWPALFFLGDKTGAEVLATGPQLAVICVGLITAIAYVLTFEVQRRTDGVGFAQVGYFATLSGIGVGAVTFGEHISPMLLIALSILFMGLAISNGQINLSYLWRRFRIHAGR
ncbi:DMT family transporter [Candidatus Halocynthiibacter alkanivorans]|uniref:DMT family transporter n=1 Tax=Candidatus Halocynthiibacter alkanivorans TaxID=2267619 RepID=UPI000DF28A81|nr:DMT family transporter [Candidatus Halocynthiibacter alkanivorans]